MKNILFILLGLIISTQSFSQKIVGYVYDSADSCKINNAIIYIVNPDNTISNVMTSTDSCGFFELEYNDTLVNSILVNKSGYKSVNIKIQDTVEIFLKKKKASQHSVVRKPVLYFYPEKEMEINVKVNVKGKLTTTYPKYNSGWNIKAKPNGDIINIADNKKHRYLFWEGKIHPFLLSENINTGFMVSRDSSEIFLNNTLLKLGFNDFEINDFMVYWLPRLEMNKFNVIHFLINEDCNKIAELEISPKPQTIIRIYMLYSGVDKRYNVRPQVIPKLSRKGFTVTEWGGRIIL